MDVSVSVAIRAGAALLCTSPTTTSSDQTLCLRQHRADVRKGHPITSVPLTVNAREVTVLGAFAAGVLLIGVWPKALTDLMETSIAQLAAQLVNSKL